MGLRGMRKKQEDETETLLEPRKKGFFGKSRRSHDIDAVNSNRPRRSGPFRGIRRKEKLADEYYFDDEQMEKPLSDTTKTPPVTPTASPEGKSFSTSSSAAPRPVNNVTVKKSPPRPAGPSKQSQQAQQRIPLEDNTVVSELTNPQDMAPRPGFGQMRPPKEVMKDSVVHGGSSTGSPPRTPPSSTPHKLNDTSPPADDSIVNRVLGLMEASCGSFVPFQQSQSDHDDIRRNLSFMHEWGVAPTMLSHDEEEAASSNNRSAKGWFHREDSTVSSKTYSTREESTLRTGQSPQPEENFEMVLEDEAKNEPKQFSYKNPDRRGWMNSKNAAESPPKRQQEPVLGIVSRESQRKADQGPPAALLATSTGRVVAEHHGKTSSSKHKVTMTQKDGSAQRLSKRAPTLEAVMEEEKKEDDRPATATEQRPVVAAVAAIARRAASPLPDSSAPQNSRAARSSKPEKALSKSAAPKTTKHGTPVTPQRRNMAVIRPSSPDPPSGHHEGVETVQAASADWEDPSESKTRGKNPATMLLWKARHARERKKTADKERRYKKILQSLDQPVNKPLATVEEEKSLASRNSTEGIRVPGLQTADAYLKPSELIGDECEEETTQVPSSRSDTVAKKDVSTPIIERSSSWRDRFSTKNRSHSKKGKMFASKSDPGASRSETSSNGTFSMKAAAGALLNNMKKRESKASRKKADPEPSIPKKESSPVRKKQDPPVDTTSETTDVANVTNSPLYQKKPCWKAAVDKKSGRTYYYHRVTRETTWKKPPEDEIVRATVQIVEPEKQNTNEGGLLTDLKKLVTDRIISDSAPGRETIDEPTELPQAKSLNERSRTVLSGRTTVASARTASSAITGATSVRSGISGRISEQTPQIKNTSRGRRVPAVTSIFEGESQGTSISSKHEDLYKKLRRSPSRSVDTTPTLPSHVPVPRRRELMVEDFSSDRKLERFETRRSARPRPLANWARPKLTTAVPKVKATPRYDATAYLGDAELTDSAKDTESFGNSEAFDSISALSEPEHDALSTDVRRRALNDAISREDWDLAASLSAGMRKTNPQQQASLEAQHREWTQSELDRFISENDWDAVAEYIARIRSKPNDTTKAAVQGSPLKNSKGKSSTELKSEKAGSPVKRFGARSQLQHSELNSDDSSWASSNSSYDSDGYSDESDSFVSDHKGNRRRQSKKEFAC